MKGKFENIDELFQSKINELSDDDFKIDEAQIWNKIERKLDRKPRLILLWTQYSVAACLLVFLGFWGFLKFGDKTSQTTPPQPSPIGREVSVSLKTHDKVKFETFNKSQKPKSKKSTISVEKKNLNFEIPNLTANQQITIEKPEIESKSIAFIPTIDSSKSIVKINKFRVVHADELNQKPIEKLKESKSFYVKFNSNNIDNQEDVTPKQLKIILKNEKY